MRYWRQLAGEYDGLPKTRMLHTLIGSSCLQKPAAKLMPLHMTSVRSERGQETVDCYVIEELRQNCVDPLAVAMMLTARAYFVSPYLSLAGPDTVLAFAMR